MLQSFALQIAMHVLVAGCSVLAMLCWVYPSRIDSEVRTQSLIACCIVNMYNTLQLSQLLQFNLQ
jgi:hypothetical protein